MHAFSSLYLSEIEDTSYLVLVSITIHFACTFQNARIVHRIKNPSEDIKYCLPTDNTYTSYNSVLFPSRSNSSRIILS